MFTIEIEDGCDAPYQPSMSIFIYMLAGQTSGSNRRTFFRKPMGIGYWVSQRCRKHFFPSNFTDNAGHFSAKIMI